MFFFLAIHTGCPGHRQRHPFNGLFSRTTWLSRHWKG